MIETRVGRNEPCPCGSGQKFKKCCLRRDADDGPTLTHIPRTQVVGRSPSKPSEPVAPTSWRHPPGQPDAKLPPSGEWEEWVFVKDKGWTHRGQVKPGDQVRLKGGGWRTIGPNRILETTQEHPFYVRGKGWTAMAEIRPGDWIACDEGWVQIVENNGVGTYQEVYNLRIEDNHTYFVRDDDWGFGVWAHNASSEYFEGVYLDEQELLARSGRPLEANRAVLRPGEEHQRFGMLAEGERYPQHHLFPRESAATEWFEARGFTRRDIDRYTVRIDHELHEALHSGNVFEYGLPPAEIALPGGGTLRINGGWYSETVMREVVNREIGLARQLTRAEVRETVLGMRSRFGLQTYPIEPYS